MSIPADKQHEARDLPAKSADRVNERLHQQVHEARHDSPNQGLGPSASEIKQANQWFSHDSNPAAHVGEQSFPNLSVSDSKEKFQNSLLDPKASSQEKLQLAESLAANGINQIQAKDADGAIHNLRLEKEELKNGHSMVHVFDENANGKENPILRGVDNGKGQFSHEIDKHGHEVSLEKPMRATANQPAGDQPQGHSDQTHNEADEADHSHHGRHHGRHEHHHHGGHHRHGSNSIEGSGSESPPSNGSLPSDSQQPQRDNAPGSGNSGQTRPDKPSDSGVGNAGTDNTNSRQQSSTGNANSLSQQALNDMFDKAKQNATGHGGNPLYFRSKMDIDADGSPRARQIDPDGQTQTSLRDQNGHSINAEKVPYIVLPGGKYQGHDLHLGDVAAVRYQGKVVFAQFADVGPHNKLGEGSMALARQLGMSDSPTHGGTHRNDVEYMVFPRSNTGSPQDVALANEQGARLLARHSGYELADN